MGNSFQVPAEGVRTSVFFLDTEIKIYRILGLRRIALELACLPELACLLHPRTPPNCYPNYLHYSRVRSHASTFLRLPDRFAERTHPLRADRRALHAACVEFSRFFTTRRLRDSVGINSPGGELFFNASFDLSTRIGERGIGERGIPVA